MQKIVVPCLIAFGMYLYWTYDRGFDFAAAEPAKRVEFAERHAVKLLHAAKLLPGPISKFATLRVDDDGSFVSVRIRANFGPRHQIQMPTYRGLTCRKYANSLLDKHSIRVQIRFEGTDGSHYGQFSLSPGICRQYKSKG